MMEITKTSPLTGQENTMLLDVTIDQVHQWKFGGVLIQDAMPQLSNAEREFPITG